MTAKSRSVLSTEMAADFATNGTGAITAAIARGYFQDEIDSFVNVTDEKGQPNGVATLDGSGKVTSSQIPAALVGAVQYQGTWNASTNSPALASGVGTKGFYYKVSVAGTTAIDGISLWNVADWIIFDGTTWDKVDGSDGTIATQNANAVAITGGAIDGTTIGGTTLAAASVTAPAAGDSSARAVTSAWSGQNSPVGYRNLFVNPGCDVDQRGTRSSPLTVTTSGARVLDGNTIVLPTGASVTAGQTAAPSGTVSQNCLSVTGAASVTDVIVRKRIESTDAAKLAGQTVTVQVKFNQNTGGSVTAKLSIGHPASADSYSGINSASLTNEVNAVNLQVASNGTTVTLAYTFACSANAANGLEINFDIGALVATQVAKLTGFDIRVTPGVATGLNANPPPVELRPIALETMLCQRYYMRLTVSARTYLQASSFLDVTFCFLPMRATPTAALVSAGSPQGNLAGSSMTPTGPSSTRFEISATATGDTYDLGEVWSLTAEL